MKILRDRSIAKLRSRSILFRQDGQNVKRNLEALDPSCEMIDDIYDSYAAIAARGTISVMTDHFLCGAEINT